MKNEMLEQKINKLFTLYSKKQNRKQEILESKQLIQNVLNMLDSQINYFFENKDEEILVNSTTAKVKLINILNSVNKESRKLDRDMPALELLLVALNEILENKFDSKEIVLTYDLKENKIKTNKIR